MSGGLYAFAVRRNVQFDILRGGHAGKLFEHLRKVAYIVKAAFQGDIGHLMYAVFHIFFCFFNTVYVQEITEGAAESTAEQPAEIAVIILKKECGGPPGYVRLVIIFDIFKNAFAGGDSAGRGVYPVRFCILAGVASAACGERKPVKKQRENEKSVLSSFRFSIDGALF